MLGDEPGVVAGISRQQKSKTKIAQQLFAGDRISSSSGFRLGGFGGEDLRIVRAFAGRQKITLGQGTSGGGRSVGQMLRDCQDCQDCQNCRTELQINSE